MLQVRALTKTFGSTTALKAVNLDVAQGEIDLPPFAVPVIRQESGVEGY